MGDSEGERRTFEDFEDDLSCAIDKFFEEVPTLKALAIWGLCDAASATLFYAYSDPRVTGLVLVNPWVRTEQGVAKVYLKHYYLKRLFDLEFRRKLWRGNFSFITSVQSFFNITADALTGRNQIKAASNRMSSDAASLPERMFYGLSRFEGNILLILSGNDFTAQEFLDLVKGSPKWQKLLTSPRVQRYDLLEANHTFSQQRWRDQVAAWTVAWIESW
jgi:exosortase A-associated hydrolase 1